MADPRMLFGTRMTCTAFRLDWRGLWHVQLGAVHRDSSGRIQCDVVKSFSAVCDDFGNLVEVPGHG
jgi:hypothetical protein